MFRVVILTNRQKNRAGTTVISRPARLRLIFFSSVKEELPAETDAGIFGKSCHSNLVSQAHDLRGALCIGLPFGKTFVARDSFLCKSCPVAAAGIGEFVIFARPGTPASHKCLKYIPEVRGMEGTALVSGKVVVKAI